jgi:hypothetical protein
MLTYSQSKGHLWRDGALIGLGYSGRGDGILNPDMQGVKDVGPLPRGLYTLWRSNDNKLGPVVYSLSPDDANDMQGRSAFFIHWDNQQQNFTASEGCIVLVTAHTFYGLRDGDRLEVIS